MTGRVRLHARIAETMEAIYGVDAESHAAELAHHYSQGVLITGPEKMLLYSRLAGEQALENFAYEEALSHFGRTLVVLQDRPMEIQYAQILHGLGRAQVAPPYYGTVLCRAGASAYDKPNDAGTCFGTTARCG